MNFEMRHRISVRPRQLKSGEIAVELPSTMIQKRHELALTISFMVRRHLFGQAYCRVQPDYFYEMPDNSGVYLCPVIKTSLFSAEAHYPGDIDLLVIPYEENDLILHRALAIEIKIIRASFAKQGKSPNEFGYSQARGLLKLGFPYAALAHLIVSDQSPESAWRDIGVARVIDSDGRVEMLPDEKVDWMPADLTDRAFGRLESAVKSNELGLIAAYIGSTETQFAGLSGPSPLWLPACRRALPNSSASPALLKKIAELFERNPSRFLDTPRHDPPKE